jgi:hypothetical protein
MLALARAELTALERDEHIAEWVRLVEKKGMAVAGPDRAGSDAPEDGRKKGQEKPARIAQVSKGGRGNQSGINAAARTLGIERKDAQRAVKVDKLSPEAKKVAGPRADVRACYRIPFHPRALCGIEP